MDIIKGVARKFGLGSFVDNTGKVPRNRKDISALDDFAINYSWVIEFPSIDGKIPIAQEQRDIVSRPGEKEKSWKESFKETLDSIKNFGEGQTQEQKLMMMAKSIDIPTPTIQTNDVYTQAYKRDMPTGMSMDNIAITLYDDTELTGFKYFYVWMKEVISEKGTFGIPGDYAKNVTVKVFDAIGSMKGKFVFSHCYPTSIEPLRLSSDSPALLELSVRMSVHRLLLDSPDKDSSLFGWLKDIVNAKNDIVSIYNDAKTTANVMMEAGMSAKTAASSLYNPGKQISNIIKNDMEAFNNKLNTLKNK